MTDPGQKKPEATAPTRNPKREAKRALAREAAARRLAAKRRRQARTGALIGLVVVAGVVGVVLLFNHGSGTPSSSSSGSPSASAAPSASISTPPALATKPTVTNPKGTPAPASLKVTTLVQGDGPAIQSGQHVYVNYDGYAFNDGTEFDSSWKSGRTPFDFTVGQGNVIPGWDQGLVGVKVGSRVQLDIPSKLAYGDSPSGGQPAGALRFVVDVLSAS